MPSNRQQRRPGPLRILPDWLVLGASTLGPLGRKLPAPGTWGSLAGLLYFLLFFQRLPDIGVIVIAAIGLLVAVGLCGEAERRLRRQDPGEIVLDEFAAVPLCFVGWRGLSAEGWPYWGVLLAGVALFRLFDIVKPLGIRRLQRWPGGWGVVADDAAAAIATCATLHLAAWLWTFR